MFTDKMYLPNGLLLRGMIRTGRHSGYFRRAVRAVARKTIYISFRLIRIIFLIIVLPACIIPRNI